jgi:twinkle protein
MGAVVALGNAHEAHLRHPARRSLLLGAGTGIGKTDVFTQIIEHIVRVHNLPVGVFSLEQSPRETAIRIAGKRAKQRFHVPDAGWTMEQFGATWDDMQTSGKVFLYDSFGQNDWDIIEDRIRFSLTRKA